MIEQLREQIKIVVEARQRASELKEARSVAYAEWEDQNSAILDNLTLANQQVIDAEIMLRELTLGAYAQTGNKTPAPGVGIREITKLEYDMKVAFDWAVEHTMALKLDTSAFEKIAKASPPNFVRVFLEPQATIATQLEIKE